MARLPGFWETQPLPDWLSRYGDRYWIHRISRARLYKHQAGNDPKKVSVYRLYLAADPHIPVAEFSTQGEALGYYARQVRSAA